MASHHRMLQTVAVIVTVLLASVNAIRVDWNTNKGPIVPPVPTQPPVPKPPFREPAPAWEDQSNDIPNPNPYKYVLPPPSRPRYNPDAPSSAYDGGYGAVYSHPNQLDVTANGRVAALSVLYIPNVGFRYYAVAPRVDDKYQYLKYNDVQHHDKINGKYYNAKLKKYKAFEKSKSTAAATAAVASNFYTHYNNVPAAAAAAATASSQQTDKLINSSRDNHHNHRSDNASHNSIASPTKY